MVATPRGVTILGAASLLPGGHSTATAFCPPAPLSRRLPFGLSSSEARPKPSLAYGPADDEENDFCLVEALFDSDFQKQMDDLLDPARSVEDEDCLAFSSFGDLPYKPNATEDPLRNPQDMDRRAFAPEPHPRSDARIASDPRTRFDFIERERARRSWRTARGTTELVERMVGRDLLLFSPSPARPSPSDYSWESSTQENYGVQRREFYGPFREIRAVLDFNYHGSYNRSRQQLQDKIVQRILNGTTIQKHTRPWIVFTAGVMGAGKSHTINKLASKGLFPLRSFVVVDPDEIRSFFPEYQLYAARCPTRAGELTNREAAYIAEIATAAAVQQGCNVLVDGSLRDYKWHRDYFESLRERHEIRIAILHITAPRETILERVAERADDTGRAVPAEALEMSLEQVPISVGKLAPAADFFCELDNSPALGEVTMRTDHITWDSFRTNWS